MADLYTILTTLKKACETDLPALFVANGLTDLAVYSASGSKDAEQTGLFIYHNESNWDYSIDRASIIFQLQLYGLDLLQASKYTDILRDYLKDYNPQNIGFTNLENLSIDTWPDEQNSTTFVFIVVSWSEPLDSCD